MPPPIPQAGFSTYNPQTFTGRDAETADLTRLLSNDRRMVAIAGMTGIGKTALAERVVANLMSRTETATLPYYRFSLDDRSLTAEFSSSGAALLRTLGEEPTLADQQDPANLRTHLLDRLCSQPCRLQIDSLERLLRGNEQEGWSEFCDPLWLNLLEQFLSRSHCPSQLLLTSQDIPADLDAVGSRYPQFWHYQTLQGLNPEEQQDLFLKLGLPQDAESLETLRRIGAFYDGHPLVLQVIADEIRQPPFQGKVDRYWQHYQAEFTSTASLPHASSPLARSSLFRRRVRQRVEQTLQRLPSPARRMLCASAVFRRPVPIAFWQAMLIDDDPQAAFDTLHDRHLVEYAPDSGDAFLVRHHNLIRSVAYDFLKTDIPTWHAAERQAAHLWLTAYEPAPNVPNLETVRGYLEAIEHYCNIEDWEAAKALLTQTINISAQSTLYQQLYIWGYFQEEIRLCKKLLGKCEPAIDVKCWNGLGNGYLVLGNYSETIKAHENCLRIAREIGDRRGEGAALGNLGNAYSSLGNYPQAINFHQQALVISQKIGNRRSEGTALGNLGGAYNSLGNYPQAINFHQQALVISQEIGNRQEEGIAIRGLGSAYNSLGNYPQAINFHQQALVISQEIGDRRGEGATLGNLGNAYFSLSNYLQAINFHQQYLTIAREIGDHPGEGIALGNLGNAYNSLGNYPQAIDFHQQYLTIAREIGDRQGEGNALGNMGWTQFKLKQYPESLANTQAALKIFQEIGDRAGEAEALKNLAELHQALGEIEVAQQYCQQALALATELGIPLAAECAALQLKIENEQLKMEGT